MSRHPDQEISNFHQHNREVFQNQLRALRGEEEAPTIIQTTRKSYRFHDFASLRDEAKDIADQAQTHKYPNGYPEEKYQGNGYLSKYNRLLRSLETLVENHEAQLTRAEKDVEKVLFLIESNTAYLTHIESLLTKINQVITDIHQEGSNDFTIFVKGEDKDTQPFDLRFFSRALTDQLNKIREVNNRGNKRTREQRQQNITFQPKNLLPDSLVYFLERERQKVSEFVQRAEYATIPSTLPQDHPDARLGIAERDADILTVAAENRDNLDDLLRMLSKNPILRDGVFSDVAFVADSLRKIQPEDFDSSDLFLEEVLQTFSDLFQQLRGIEDLTRLNLLDSIAQGMSNHILEQYRKSLSLDSIPFYKKSFVIPIKSLQLRNTLKRITSAPSTKKKRR